MKTVYEIDGNNFSNLASFYSEFSNKVLDTIEWGHNLDAFNDVLSGGFGTPDEGFILNWSNSAKSKEDLGWHGTIKFLEEKITTCPPQNVKYFQKELMRARESKGQTIFNILVEIIESHKDIELHLK